MKQNITLFNLILFISSFSFAQVSPHDMVTKMGRGINLGNILSAPQEGNWAPTLKKSYLDDLKSVGFKTVRIPIDFFGDRTSGNTTAYSKQANTANSYNGKSTDYIVNSDYLDRIEEVIQWSLQNNLITILDFHGSELKTEFLYTFSPKDKWSEYYTAPTSAKRAADNEKFRAIWKQIAERFKDYSENLIFEVVNEPYFWLSASEMDHLNLDIINIIRNSGNKNTNRNIIITGGSENAYEAPLQISDNLLNSDNYLIPTFHYYLPRSFTASGSEEHNDFTWGTNTDKTNADVECGETTNWNLFVQTPAVANLTEAAISESRGNSKSIHINVSEDGGAFNKTILKNEAINAISFSKKTVLFKTYAKALTNTAKFKIRIKTVTNGSTQFSASPAFSLSNSNYQSFEYEFTVPENTTSLEFQILCGKTKGDYFFDDFSMEEKTLSTETSIQKTLLNLYPNPAKNYINVTSSKTIHKINLCDVNGKSYPLQFINNKIDVTKFEKGIYFIAIKFEDGSLKRSKILIQKNSY
ncbi:cellulase family glycosylhydrolase [Polaribacter septentrionalilitoris]|uniref:cellulase family glycosylhydrolase n=1 Tax=Polaribacter septentrionalilitoris TaxID=2494657 RepID=UPI001356B5E8|nr:cellulase family glycosylhydrolase [Polaribacter septentrionalilitoris]